MYRETIEHPFSIPEPIKKHLDLTSGKDLGRLYNLVPEGGLSPAVAPAESAPGTPNWSPLLADSCRLVARDGPAAPDRAKGPGRRTLLKALARDRPTALGRVHALWTLQALGSLGADDLLPALRDSDANVREQAARLCDGHLGEGSPLVESLLALARRPGLDGPIPDRLDTRQCRGSRSIHRSTDHDLPDGSGRSLDPGRGAQLDPGPGRRN